MSDNPDVYMPIVIGDWMKHTRRLSRADRGTYMDILIEYWVSGPPPDDAEVLARIAGVSVEEWREIDPKIRPFFRIEKGHWRNKRLDAEKKLAIGRKAKAKQASKARWDRQKSKKEPVKNQTVKDDAPSIARASSEHGPEHMPLIPIRKERAPKEALSLSTEHDPKPKPCEAARSPLGSGARPTPQKPEHRTFSAAEFRNLAEPVKPRLRVVGDGSG